MKNVKLASRYAQALFDFAVEKNQLEQVYQDILLIMQTLKSNRELTLAIECPVVPYTKKVKVFTGIFEQAVSKVSFGFLKLVIAKKREPALLLICFEFIRLYNKYHNIKVLDFITAQEVREPVMEKLKALMHERTGAMIEVKSIITPQIIGGFIVRMDDFVFDASILKQINTLKREFSHNIYQAGF